MRIARIILVLAVSGALSCGPSPYPREVLVPQSELVSAGPTADSVVVAVFDTVDPAHAPRPQNESERFVFAHLYQTVAGDPTLAELVRCDDDRRRCTFLIREGARFWDGTPVTAGDVLASWRDPEVQRALVDSAVDSVEVLDQRTLRVYAGRDDWHPMALEAPVFAVAKPAGPGQGRGWRMGSGPYRVDVSASRGPSVVIRHRRGGYPAITFLTVQKRHARDVIEGHIDVMLTRDRDVIDYATGDSRFDVVALDWDRSYFVLAPARARAVRAGEQPPPLPQRTAARLASDVVPADARPRTAPLWPELSRCGDGFFDMPWLPPATTGAPQRRVLYDEDDVVARSLVERIVALAGRDAGTSEDAAAVAAAIPGIADGPVRAEGVPADVFAQSLRHGDDVAYVTARRPAFDRCRDARELIEAARWLVGLHADLNDVWLPLVTTRPYAIVARGQAAVYADRNGLRIVPGFAKP